MLTIEHARPTHNCQGMSRRSAIKAGFLGLTGLSLADLLRLRAHGAAEKNDKSVVLIWLDGGPSQLESYDPKPHAPSDYRGPFGALQTNVPGMIVSETLPLHTKLADKMAFIRSVHHDNGDHFAGGHWMLTGRFGSNAASLPQKYPSFGSYISKLRGPNVSGMPAYVGLPAAQSIYLFPGYMGAAYLGAAYNPFDVDTEQKYLHFTSQNKIGRPRCLDSFGKVEVARAGDRQTLLSGLDQIERQADQSGLMKTVDRYQQDAFSMVLGGKAREAFNLDLEDPKAIDKYGNNPWGRYTLMARRLVEAGTTFATVDMPHWDDHSNIEKGHGGKLEAVDRAVAALIDDLDVRGILDRTLVIVMGEFGRTPKINSGQPGIPIPGRDHWGNAISVMMAGGGLKGGVIVGATNSKAEFPIERALKPADILATVYHVMGIDPSTSFKDFAGRPVPMLDEGAPIAELI
ncbi:MAG: DUF1501 domain-containing protein [Planctomycetaceae bacterium]